MVNEIPFTREQVVKALTDNEFTRVTFYKVNGELRDMLCTTNPSQMALLAKDPDFSEAIGYDTDTTIEYDDNQIRVFDVEKKGWRSFLLTNLITYEGINT